MAFKTSKEIIASLIEASIQKSKLPVSKILVLGFLAGVYIAFGAILAMKVGGGVPTIKQENGGLSSFLFGAVFPVGLMFVIIAGAELFTGNTAILVPAWFQKKITSKDVFKNLLLSYVTNFIGSVFVAYFFAYLTNIFANSPWLETTMGIAEAKVSQSFFVLFLKATACNWLVCLAVWLATASDNISGKILGIWFPIMAFVAIGFEHSVANMFFIPLGIFYGADISWATFFVDNLLPVTLGNILGGMFFVGLVYTYIHKD
ncbi:MAG: formate/nitrite transporter family protein [Cytophagales bacterium]|nr:formate/nitrite transporter family protein [Cytophagales bacterium]